MEQTTNELVKIPLVKFKSKITWQALRQAVAIFLFTSLIFFALIAAAAALGLFKYHWLPLLASSAYISFSLSAIKPLQSRTEPYYPEQYYLVIGPEYLVIRNGDTTEWHLAYRQIKSVSLIDVELPLSNLTERRAQITYLHPHTQQLENQIIPTPMDDSAFANFCQLLQQKLPDLKW